ncbi:nicotinate phosphoribosyltransferase [Trypanosoma cruzi Dm28c]|uniref:nicotinate phosphoribosyltransferase n=2 Tax=Trypanosoma cruzi TaxID=5693 RepID=V5AZU7_TRYCR|nr:nicotinate phosphoribosyltransferase [Trypanosoma cruzi Dm28c]PBJ75724.1 nicotinate phosphoribosyltransferase [Trypanosoma cruzi cruzi]PWU90704.1 putative nicotinate phosphoribosyltransferase [Trypanosoma cruzi]
MVDVARPIITSVLDTDAYKLHMQQAVFHLYPSVCTAFDFCCRDRDEHFGDAADAIREEVHLMQNLALTDDEYKYLASKRYLRKDYLDWLREYRFNPQQVTVRAVPSDDGNMDLAININGPWVETILWEVPLLAIVSEVVHRRRTPNLGVAEALAHLEKKLEAFFAHTTEESIETFCVSEFGTRRRYSFGVQEAVVKALHSHPKFGRYFCGTSNYLLAKNLGLPAVGTQAHEWFQAHQQLTPILRDSQRVALTQWLKEYPHDLRIALTDCISMDSFLCDFTKDLADAYTGLRHDSGDPIEWGQKAVKHYRKLGIDPKTKTLVFSDSLDLEKAAMLHRIFSNEINVMCGIGTQLSCSIPGARGINIVVKMTDCEGKPVAKLSDDPGKTICRDRDFISELRRAFGLPIMAVALVTAVASVPNEGICGLQA